MSGTGVAPDYAVPALEKALDVLELLAASPLPHTQQEIAASTGRTVSQLFRILTVLERRGYVGRAQTSGAYSLTTRMLRLALQQEPIASIVRLSQDPLQQLAAETSQSCNLGVRDGDAVLVVAQAIGHADFGFQVRVGARFPIEGSPTGELLAAYEDETDAGATVRASGHVARADHLHAGVTDLVFPVLDVDGAILAALTVPYVDTSHSTHRIETVRAAGARTAAVLSTTLGGGRRDVGS